MPYHSWMLPSIQEVSEQRKALLTRIIEALPDVTSAVVIHHPAIPSEFILQVYVDAPSIYTLGRNPPPPPMVALLLDTL